MHLPQSRDSMLGAGLDAAVLILAALCPVCPSDACTAGASGTCGRSLGAARRHDPVCELLTPPELQEGEAEDAESDEEPPCGLLEKELAEFKHDPEEGEFRRGVRVRRTSFLY